VSTDSEYGPALNKIRALLPIEWVKIAQETV